MPHELRDFSVALRYLEQNPEQNLMMRRSLGRGPRPGFAAIVDDLEMTRALMLVERPDWKKSGPTLTRIQLDAVEMRAAVHLLSWLHPFTYVQIRSYRPWLQELAQSILDPVRVIHKVHCVADRHQFRPGALQHLVREITPEEYPLWRQAAAMGRLLEPDRLFGIVEGENLLACATLGRPDGPFISVGSVHTREAERYQGYGSAVLSAATDAGLREGKVVTYGLPVADVPALHLVAGLGFAPACREWAAEGRPRA